MARADQNYTFNTGGPIIFRTFYQKETLLLDICTFTVQSYNACFERGLTLFMRTRQDILELEGSYQIEHFYRGILRAVQKLIIKFMAFTNLHMSS